MQVTFISSTDINSDLGIVNAARVSLHKRSTWEHKCPDHINGKDCLYYKTPPCNMCSKQLSWNDCKLIQYLADHKHWTPFAHSRLYFVMDMFNQEVVNFLLGTQQRGFNIVRQRYAYHIQGSFYAWAVGLKHLIDRKMEYVLDCMYKQYPISTTAFTLHPDYPSFIYSTQSQEYTESYVIQQGWWKLACATLLVKVPIFVARQIRTSQVGFAYSDAYVEGEAFCYNEVSRRYVNEEPKLYQIQQWRVRECGSIKQGSTDIACPSVNCELNAKQAIAQDIAIQVYNAAQQISAAPEQARALLPQSMYTEFYMTGTLHRWAQWLSLRLQRDVQEETRQVAMLILRQLTEQFPMWADAYKPYIESTKVG